MNTRALLSMCLPALLATTATVAMASSGDASAEVKQAAKVAARAERALHKRDVADGVALAERAVELSPRDAGFRALLGRAYLQAGRFASARTTFEEVLVLDGRDGRAALNLVLAQIATGDWATARRMLDEHADKISVRDRGLAVALTGDPASAVALLTQAAREPGATAKTRQNLALSLALAGQWQAARVVAAADLSPADVDARMLEWIAFAQPRSSSDQVAHLLGVRAVEDAGRPISLALDAPVAPAGPTAQARAEVAIVAVPASAPAPGIVFGPRREVVQALPAPVFRPERVAARGAPERRPTAPAARSGDWYVQLGAFDSVGVARDAWSRATRRFAAFRSLTPTGGFLRGGRSFYRLSVGGFAREDAQGMCLGYRAKGGACFVRMKSGDQVAAWAKPARAQLAAR